VRSGLDDKIAGCALPTSYMSSSSHSFRASVDELTLQGELKVAIGYWWFRYNLSQTLFVKVL